MLSVAYCVRSEKFKPCEYKSKKLYLLNDKKYKNNRGL